MMRIAFLILAGGLLVTGTAAAPMPTSRATADFYRCTFDRNVTARFDIERGTFKLEEDDDPFRGSPFIFTDVDLQRGSAVFVGEYGSSSVEATRGAASSSIIFIERPVLGTLNVTVIYAGTNTARGYPAVLSRHTVIPFGDSGPIPSQAYGFCETA